MQNSNFPRLCQLKKIVCPHKARPQGRNWVFLILNWACGAGKVVYLINLSQII
jgi:hypothetical protein